MLTSSAYQVAGDGKDCSGSRGRMIPKEQRSIIRGDKILCDSRIICYPDPTKDDSLGVRGKRLHLRTDCKRTGPRAKDNVVECR